MLICCEKFSSLRSFDAALSRCSLAALVTATPTTVTLSLAALLVWGGAVTAMSPRYGGGAVLTATARALGQVRGRYGTVERQG